MSIAQVHRYFRDARVPAWRKWVGVLALAYLVMPLDLVPDVLPLVGWVDDLGALAAALGFMSREVNRHAEKPSTVHIVDGTVVR